MAVESFGILGTAEAVHSAESLQVFGFSARYVLETTPFEGTQRQAKLIQDPVGSYFGSVPQWFYVLLLLQKNAKVEYFNRVHHVSVSNNSQHVFKTDPIRPSRPCEAAPGTRWPRNLGTSRNNGS